MPDIEANFQQLGTQALQDLYNNLISSKAFVLEHAPDICQQVITWQITKGAVVLLVLTVLTVVVVWKRRVLFSHGTEIDKLFLALGLIIVGVIMLMFGSVQVMGAIKAIVAPKLFLLEYISDII